MFKSGDDITDDTAGCDVTDDTAGCDVTDDTAGCDIYIMTYFHSLIFHWFDVKLRLSQRKLLLNEIKVNENIAKIDTKVKCVLYK